jgi:hypothetical protein
MKPFEICIDSDDPNLYRVAVNFHEGDTLERFGRRAEIIVYVESGGRCLPDAAKEISSEALSSARTFMRKILDESAP